MITYHLFYNVNTDLKELVQAKNINNDKNLLIQVFCGISEISYIRKLCQEIMRVFPQAHILGTTTAGEIYLGEIERESCILAISSFDHTVVRTGFIQNRYHDSFRLGRDLAQKLDLQSSKVLIAFADGLHTNGDEFLEGIESIHENVVLAGGLAGDNRRLKKTYVFTEQGITSCGAVGAVLSGPIHVYTDAHFDWLPIGRKLKVTEAKNNIIYSIEHKSPVSIYEKYLGKIISQNLPYSSNQFPLIVERQGRSVSRPVLSVLEQGALQLGGAVYEGEKVRFGYGDWNHIIDSAKQMFHRICQQPIESLFYYSCTARMEFLKDVAEQEMALMSQEVPASGFFGYGQFSHRRGKNRFVSQTLTILVLSEQEQATLSQCALPLNMNYSHAFKVKSALYTLVQRTSNELEILNQQLEKKVEEKVEEVKSLYFMDQLTGLPNRFQLLEQLEKGTFYKLAVINIDGFRLINDFFGNQFGDQLLKDFSRRLVQFSVKFDLQCYRIGGDEFVLAAGSSLLQESFLNLLRTLQSLIELEYMEYENQNVRISVTIGVALNQSDPLVKANLAIKYARLRHRDLQVYDETLPIYKEYEKNLIWNRKIQVAIEEDRIVPYFQPIYNHALGQVDKYEVLMRLIDSDGTVVSPFVFLDVAKRTRLYLKLTAIMISKACQKFKNRTEQISINITADDISDSHIRELIHRQLKDTDLAKRLVFELVESEGIERFDLVRQFIDEVKSKGAHIAIDDFGTGYSNFAYLMQLQADFLKIDGSMIKNLDRDESAETVVESIVHFAAKLGMKTVAEFVHSAAIDKKVKALGIDYSQGYFIGEPQPTLMDDMVGG